MRIRTARMIVAASLFSAGLATWSGCSTENPDGTPTKLGTAEEKAKEGLNKAGEVIKKDAKIVADEVKKDAKIVADEVKKDAKIVEDKVKDGVDKVKGSDKKPE